METKNDKLIERLLTRGEAERSLINKQLSEFYPNGTLTDFAGAEAGDNPFKQIFSTLRLGSAPQPLTDDAMFEACLQIRRHVKEKQAGHTEINFRHGVQRINGRSYPLASTLIKARAMLGDSPVFLYVGKENSLNSIIFIGGDSADAFLVTRDDDGKDCVVRLEEFHALSISEHSVPGDEVGLMTSFHWKSAQVSTGIVTGNNLDPIKSLLLSEAFRKIEATQQESAEIETGGDKDE